MKKSLNKILSAVKNNLSNYKKLDWLYGQSYNDYKSSKINLGQMQSAANKSGKDILKLSDTEFQVFSQFGDDGIIQWLVTLLPLPNKTFIEFGVENYREANTRFLLINNYWSGLVIDGNPDNISSIKREQIYTFYDLQAECSFITKSNIRDLISSAKFDEEVGILSIDIDGNDYWIWKEIDIIKPIIIICEYNCLFGIAHSFTIEYEDTFVRGEKYPFSFYGTSLRSACDLAQDKGYVFIGCNNAGNNAYFLRNDYVKYLTIPVVSMEEGYVFSSFTESSDGTGCPFRGPDKIRAINNLPVINTRTGMKEMTDANAIIDPLILAKKLTRS